MSVTSDVTSSATSSVSHGDLALPDAEPGHAPTPPLWSREFALLSLAALGVVFGDIGTSPLYALRECFHGEHGVPVTAENVVGICSLLKFVGYLLCALVFGGGRAQLAFGSKARVGTVGRGGPPRGVSVPADA